MTSSSDNVCQSPGLFRETPWQYGAQSLNVAVGPKNGPPLLLIHGVGRNWHDFAPVLPALVPFWEVHAVDLRGHGRSARATSYFIRDYVPDIVALVQRIGEPVVLLGHSLGAILSATVATEISDLIRGVILEDPPSAEFLAKVHHTSYGPIFQTMSRLAGSSSPVSEIAAELGRTVVSQRPDGGDVLLSDVRDAASLRFSARCLTEVDPKVYEPILESRWLDGLDLHTIWPRLRAPTLLLAGDESTGGMLSAAAAREIKSQLPDGSLVEFPGVGHQIHWLACEATLRVVLPFLESVR